MNVAFGEHEAFICLIPISNESGNAHSKLKSRVSNCRAIRVKAEAAAAVVPLLV